MNKYCNYFQAHVPPTDCFLVIGFLKSYEHICFARTLSKEKSIIEFFVPEETTKDFYALAHLLEKRSMLYSLTQVENRLFLKERNALL